MNAENPTHVGEPRWIAYARELERALVDLNALADVATRDGGWINPAAVKALVRPILVGVPEDVALERVEAELNARHERMNG